MHARPFPFNTKVLNWLHDHHSLRTFRKLWNVSASTVLRETRFLIPILAFYMKKIAPIEWPDPNAQDNVPGLEHFKLSGAIDCTTHYRVTDAYVPQLFYRGDHHASSLTAERTCSSKIVKRT
jgi:hypothetical protein